MKAFKRFSLASIIATYFLIFVGGMVRVSGSGLGCPDWPKCFGRWIPPTSIRQLPPDIDPGLFNLTLAWIEYVNRLIGMIVGLLILITAVLAIKHFRANRKIVLPSAGAALLVAFQGWLGGQVVASSLEPYLSSIHLGIAILIVSLLLYADQQVRFLDSPEKRIRLKITPFYGRMVIVLWIAVIVQIVLGTQLRSHLEVLEKNFPLLDYIELFGRIGPVDELHKTLGLLLFIGTWLSSFGLMKALPGKNTLLYQSTLWATILVALQIIFGIILIRFGLKEISQLFHLWIASLYAGSLLMIFTSLKREEVVQHAD